MMSGLHADNFDVTVTLTFELLDIKCHKFFFYHLLSKGYINLSLESHDCKK